MQRPTTTRTQSQQPGTSGTTVAPAPAPAAPPAPNPLDSTYLANIGASQRATADTIAGYNRSIANADTALTAADYTNPVTAPQLYHQHAVDVLAQQIAANRTGGLFSSSLGQHIGNVDQGYQNRYTTARSTHDTTVADLANRIALANDAESQYEAGQLGATVDRASAAAQANPALGLPTTPSRPAVGSSAGAHGAIVAPYGASKPPDKAGYRTVGTGNGSWIYVKR